ncbi:hypothetical protein NL676_019442 [Syzygium grande]|nr:hypothetical protein NL676_019442 [Syzygium grande]
MRITELGNTARKPNLGGPAGGLAVSSLRLAHGGEGLCRGRCGLANNGQGGGMPAVAAHAARFGRAFSWRAKAAKALLAARPFVLAPIWVAGGLDLARPIWARPSQPR